MGLLNQDTPGGIPGRSSRIQRHLGSTGLRWDGSVRGKGTFVRIRRIIYT